MANFPRNMIAFATFLIKNNYRAMDNLEKLYVKET